MSDINIRLVCAEDLPALAQVYAEVYKAFDVGEKWDLKSAKSMLKWCFEKQPDLSYLAEYEGNIVGGFFVEVKPWWDGNHLNAGEIFVHPDFQKKKVGTKLSIAVYKKALEVYQVKEWYTFTFKKTVFPLSWYKQQGFKEVEDWTMIHGNVKELLENLEKRA